MRRKYYLTLAIIVGTTAIVGMVVYQLTFRNVRIPDTGTEMYQQPTAENSSPSVKNTGIADKAVVPEVKQPITVAERDTVKEEIFPIDTPLVYGKITDESGKPLEGVDIVADIVVPRSIYNQPQKRVETKSGTDGIYLLKDMRLNTNYVLLMHLEGYIDTESDIFTLTKSRKKIEKNFIMKHGIVLSGYVRSEYGTAILGVDVSARKASRKFYVNDKKIEQMKERLYKTEPIAFPHAKTDGNGFFRLIGIGEGDREITAGAEGYVSSEKIIHISFKEQLPLIEIILKKTTCFISGKVTDKKGMPIKGAGVECYQKCYGLITKRTQTDGTGLYRLEGLVNAPAIIRVSADKFISQEKEGINTNSEDIDFVLDPSRESGKINGRVLDAERGTPITRFSILVEYRGIGYDRNSIKEIESANGEFSIDAIDVWPRKGLVIDVSAEGYETGKSEPVTVQEGETYGGIIIYLKQGRSLYGRVVDNISCKPVSGAFVYQNDKVINIINMGIDIWGFGRPPDNTLTDSEGMFILNGISQEATSVVVWHPDYVPQVVQIPVGTSQIQIILSQGAILEGRVLKGGEPVTMGLVAIPNKWCITEEDGSYRISGLSGGKYRFGFGEVILNEDGFQTFRGREMDVEIGEYGVTRHDFILQTGECMIEGTVYLKPDIPAIGVGVSLRNEGGDEQIETYTYSNTSGRYRLERLLPGTYEISANNKKQSITLTESETVTVDFQLDSERR